MSHLHPDTGLPYFGHDSDWTRLVDVVPSHRSTTSSRKPGKAIEGTIWHAIRKASVCPACGRVTGGFPGAHAPRFATPGNVVDCIGRPCARDVAGYYQVVTT